REGVDAYPVMRAKSMLIENADASLVPALNVRGEGFLPLASVPLKTVVSCNESGQWLIYKSDIHGFHNPPGAWQTAPVEIAVVGDSFAHGSCVQSEQNTAALLRNRFGNVLNLGISGFGPLTELVSLREYAAPLKPKTVVWFYFEGNDLIEDLVFEKRSELLMRYYRDEDFTQGLIGHSADISKYLKVYLDERLVEAMNRVDDPNEYLMDFLTLFHLRETFGLGAVSLGVLDGGGSKGDLEMFANILDKARRSVESWDGKFYFVYLPESPRYFAAARDNDIRDHLRNEVLKQVAALKIPLIDLHPSFAAQPDPRRMFQYPGSHYSPEGYKVAADAIGRVLSDFSAR
ncbi:MAG: GDSL-type esterase/lipase family protein, partial [Rhodospirillales bacterium]|nr:GDSL-type esterase/lipase family protein [Rhodospirillales bacterium]